MVRLLDFRSAAGYGVCPVDAASDPVDVRGRQARWLDRRPAHVRACAGNGALSTWNPAGLRGPGAVPPVSRSPGSCSVVSYTAHGFVRLSQFAHCPPACTAVGAVALDDAGLRFCSYLRRQGRRRTGQDASAGGLGAEEKAKCDKHLAAGSDDLPDVVWHVRVCSEQ